MPRITITLEGSLEEVLPVLQRMSEARPPSEHTEQTVAVEPARSTRTRAARTAPAHWTEDKVEKVWQTLRPEARRVLKEYATSPDGISWDELQSRLGLSPRQIGGRLSSLGHNLRRHGFTNGYPYPLEEVGDDVQKLEPTWQQVISRLEV